jgi:hypothetical protein
VMNASQSDDSRAAIEQHAQLSALLEEAVYTDPIKAQILELVAALGIDRADDGGRYAELRQIRGQLLRRPRGGEAEVAAAGRADWVGWVELMGT